uniref:Reverse transcriptase domain-containing protein n=1 Tax=Timema monikensis TaxID=170555 RepID=A0A7R9E8S4_9NEOP|nr:unnamed protein product [Timema monikensis]
MKKPRNALLWKIDLRSGFFQILVAEDSRRFTSVYHKGTKYSVMRLPMGYAQHGRILQKVAREAITAIEEVCPTITGIAYLDDFLFFNEDKDVLEHVPEFAKTLELTLNKEKSSKTPSQKITYLSFTVDSQTSTLELTDEAHTRAVTLLRHLPKTDDKGTQKIAGYFTWISVPLGNHHRSRSTYSMKQHHGVMAGYAPYSNSCTIQRFDHLTEINKAKVIAALLTFLWEYQTTGVKILNLNPADQPSREETIWMLRDKMGDATEFTAAEVPTKLMNLLYVQLLWSLELVETHEGRAFGECSTRLTVPFGALVEGIATCLCRVASKALSDLEPRFGTAIDSFIGTALVVAAFNYSGGYFNPVLATSLKYGCHGNTIIEHIVVYWIGACCGAIASVFVYELPVVQNLVFPNRIKRD